MPKLLKDMNEPQLAEHLNKHRKQEIKRRLEFLERGSLHPVLTLVLKDMRDLLTELDRLDT